MHLSNRSTDSRQRRRFVDVDSCFLDVSGPIVRFGRRFGNLLDHLFGIWRGRREVYRYHWWVLQGGMGYRGEQSGFSVVSFKDLPGREEAYALPAIVITPTADSGLALVLAVKTADTASA